MKFEKSKPEIRLSKWFLLFLLLGLLICSITGFMIYYDINLRQPDTDLSVTNSKQKNQQIKKDSNGKPYIGIVPSNIFSENDISLTSKTLNKTELLEIANYTSLVAVETVLDGPLIDGLKEDKKILQYIPYNDKTTKEYFRNLNPEDHKKFILLPKFLKIDFTEGKTRSILQESSFRIKDSRTVTLPNNKEQYMFIYEGTIAFNVETVSLKEYIGKNKLDVYNREKAQECLYTQCVVKVAYNITVVCNLNKDLLELTPRVEDVFFYTEKIK